MDHGYFIDRLSAFIDGELRPEETRAVEEHLEGCSQCREEVERLRKLDRLVEEHSGLDGDDYFEKAARKIEQRLGDAGTTITDISGTSGKRFGGLWWKVTSVAASVAVLVFIGVHQDDIFGPDDLVLPTVTQPQEIPASPDMIEPLPDTEAGEETTTLQDREVDEPEMETEDLDELKAVGSEEREIEPPAMSAPVPLVEEAEETDVLLEDELPPPPPPAPQVGRSRREAATSAASDEPTLEAATDDNYKRKTDVTADQESVEKSYREEKALDESIEIDIAEDDFEPSRGLSYWVQRRDSLQALTRPEGLAERAKSVLRDIRPNSLAQIPAPPEAAPSPEELEAGLLEAWYWIVRLSEDSSEGTSARAELERVAADSTSANQGLANDYLSRLGNK